MGLSPSRVQADVGLPRYALFRDLPDILTAEGS